MLGWLRRIGERIRDALADAIDAIRERFFSREEGDERDEWDEKDGEIEDGEELQELEEELEEMGGLEEEEWEVEGFEGGEIGDETVIEQLEAAEEAAEAVEEETIEVVGAEEEQEAEEAEDESDADVLRELFNETLELVAEHELLLTNAELTHVETLLDDAAALLDELEQLDDDDRNAAIDLILETLAIVEDIVMWASERGQDLSCDESRGPFASYEDAVAYARTIPCPVWVYTDGAGWWYVCLDDCSPR